MNIRTYEVKITGLIDCIMHHDNIDWAEKLKKWRQDPANKKFCVAGDDRSPAFSWLGSLYHDGEIIVVPSDNLMSCLREGSTMVPVPGGKNGKTFKSQSQSGIIVTDENWPFYVGGKTIKVAPLLALCDEMDFEANSEAAQKAGFMLYVKPAKIKNSRHIRVRPRFSNWSTSGMVQVIDDQITPQVLQTIFGCSGSHKGLFDWRPGNRTPGPFGRFRAEIREVKNA
jgi:hypothetical protein